MNMIKQTRQEFVDELMKFINANREEFVRREMKFDDNDIGVFIDSFVRYYSAHQDDEFCIDFWRRFSAHIGDCSITSSFLKAQTPFSFLVAYKDKTISHARLGEDVYSDVYGILSGYIQRMADNFIVPKEVIEKYLEGETKYRDYLLGYLNFMTHRNWTIIWAKTDWIKTVFPKAYEKMMKDGEFMSVEELWARVQEDKNE